MSALQQVHVRVNDAATGKPTPCRVRFTDEAGNYYPPHGRVWDVSPNVGIDVGGSLCLSTADRYPHQKWAYIDGSCEIELPTGLIDIHITKGPEYLPLHQQLQLHAGKLAWRLTLERWSHLRQHDWYPGDVGAHYLSPPAALLEGAAEDLAVVNVLAFETGKSDYDDQEQCQGTRFVYANLLEFSGQKPALENEDCMVVVNTLNTHPQLGALALLNCHRIVYPLSMGWRQERHNLTLADWCDQCHRKRGLVVWMCPLWQSKQELCGEALADTVLGKVDAFEINRFALEAQDFADCRLWYDLLSSGFRTTLVGASSKISNQVPLGCVRTYARLQENQPLSYAHWIEAVRSGRTFVTSGPLLLFTANDQDSGAVVQIASGQPVKIRAEARSLTPFDHLEIVANGEVVALQAASGDPATARLEAEIPMPQGGWVAARCVGKTWVAGNHGGQHVGAHSSAVYVEVDGRPASVDAGAVQRLRGHVEKVLKWVDEVREPWVDRQRLRKVFEDAVQVLQQRV
jgi:hypothetical protein